MLANGSIATVSQTSSPDLFWALRGAGHNFGVVTELTLRIYDADPVRTWAHEMHFFAQDQLEHVFEALEDMVQRQGPTDSCFTLFTNMPEIDPDKVCIHLFLSQRFPVSPTLFCKTRVLQPSSLTKIPSWYQIANNPHNRPDGPRSHAPKIIHLTAFLNPAPHPSITTNPNTLHSNPSRATILRILPLQPERPHVHALRTRLTL